MRGLSGPLLTVVGISSAISLYHGLQEVLLFAE